MKTFDYSIIPNELLDYDIIKLITKIHEYKGKQELYIKAKPQILESLLEVARIQSTGASNRIEGIHTSEKRLKELMLLKTQPKNRSEEEITGYREVLRLIHESYEHIVPTSGVILQLYRDLYQFSPVSNAGKYKNADNIITEVNVQGNTYIRFQPLSAYETPSAMESLTETFNETIKDERNDPLLLIPMFILDFLCIHPFNDGNGRMSRLLTLLNLYRAGYIVGKYISIEMIIEKTKETYYEVLKESSQNWIEGNNKYKPFVKYYLEVILSAYKEFSLRVELVQEEGMNKQIRIRQLFNQSLGTLNKKTIQEKYPDISIPTIELALSNLLKEGYIEKIGRGRATAYIKNTINKN
ncbi:MAG: Fic family protein [Firmicutes bacterium]|nr:Fic family protein [Bacillota bacterium]